MRYKEAISKVIKIYDSRSKKIEYIKERCLEHQEIVNINVRNFLNYISCGKLKYIIGFNLYRERIESINKNKKMSFYLHYYESKD